MIEHICDGNDVLCRKNIRGVCRKLKKVVDNEEDFLFVKRVTACVCIVKGFVLC